MPKVDRTAGMRRWIRFFRKQAKMRQQDLADAIGMERTSITNIEGGSQSITVENLKKILEVTGWEAQITFRRKPSNPPAPTQSEFRLTF